MEDLPMRALVRKTAWCRTAVAILASAAAPPRAERREQRVSGWREMAQAAAAARHHTPRCSLPASPRRQRGHAPKA
eukprot:8305855-Heterocapsa_arctica.AAC.1